MFFVLQGALGPTSKPEPTKTLEVWTCKHTCTRCTWANGTCSWWSPNFMTSSPSSCCFQSYRNVNSYYQSTLAAYCLLFNLSVRVFLQFALRFDFHFACYIQLTSFAVMCCILDRPKIQLGLHPSKNGATV